MATVYDDTPMSVRMKRALDASKKWTAEEHVDILVEVGLIPESRRARAVENLKRSMQRKRKPRPAKSTARSKAGK